MSLKTMFLSDCLQFVTYDEIKSELIWLLQENRKPSIVPHFIYMIFLLAAPSFIRFATLMTLLCWALCRTSALLTCQKIQNFKNRYSIN